MAVSGFYRTREDGLDLFVRLTPKSSVEAIDRVAVASDGSRHLAVRVRALPEKGAANVALERLLAARLGLPKSAVSVVAGSTSRLKTVRLLGNPLHVVQALEEAASPAGRL